MMTYLGMTIREAADGLMPPGVLGVLVSGDRVVGLIRREADGLSMPAEIPAGAGLVVGPDLYAELLEAATVAVTVPAGALD